MELKKLFSTILLLTAIPCTLFAQPSVTGDTRFARGATMAFGRIKSISANGGSTITKRGFCIAENPNPTIDDSVSTKTISSNGTIYYFVNLKPSTKYYMRAYATNQSGVTGYGDVIKFYTLPKGNVTYWYNNGGSSAENTRINNALTQACDIFSNLTSIKKHFDVDYGSGTPTADCNYKDRPHMNVGPNQSYQKTGTIMHEMQHGLGVISYSTQWCGSILRSGNGTGQWLGDRVSEFLDFWDNTTGSHLNGDTQHMWPYGVNGAHEDDGTLRTYYANAMIGQALGEDGLEHRSNTFAEPCYLFDQEDNVKYYLKNESDERGLYTSYLTLTNTGALKWKTMSSAEVQQNDSAAWYITFTPDNQYYQFRNVATGKYLTYSSAFTLMNRGTITNADNFHLMKGRVDVGSGSQAKRGYWLIHPTGNLTPNCLQANANGAIGSATFNIANTATAQRWLILTASEAEQIEANLVEGIKQKTTDVLSHIKPLAEVPHTERVEGANQAFADAISSIESRIASSNNITELGTLTDEATAAALNFLSGVSPTDPSKPFELTYMLQNASIDNNSDGWSVTATVDFSCAEFYQKTFDFNQTVKNLPAGYYQVGVQAFQRPGSAANAYTAYNSDNDNVTVFLYGDTKTKAKKIKQICAEMQTRKLGGNESTVGGNKYVPNNMEAASIYFKKGLYQNRVTTSVAAKGGQLKMGLRTTKMDNSYWAIFDNFQLYYFGDVDPDNTTGIMEQQLKQQTSNTYYDIQGRQLQQLPTRPGLYIIGGRKVIIKK
nr:hypothetical protein [uncultured Prevotella sp.]